MKTLFKPACVVMVALPLMGCLTDGTGPKEGSGTVIGGAAGGLLGYGLGGGVIGTGIGALLGAVVGNQIGKSMDETDRQRAWYAADRSLRTGRPTRWANKENTRHGTFKPEPAYYDGRGQTCRKFTHRLFVDGREELVTGTACRLSDGTWRVVGA